MKDYQIDLMLSTIVQELDYDIWKNLFDPECMEDPERASETRLRLKKVVKKFLHE